MRAQLRRGGEARTKQCRGVGEASSVRCLDFSHSLLSVRASYRSLLAGNNSLPVRCSSDVCREIPVCPFSRNANGRQVPSDKRPSPFMNGWEWPCVHSAENRTVPVPRRSQSQSPTWLSFSPTVFSSNSNHVRTLISRRLINE